MKLELDGIKEMWGYRACMYASLLKAWELREPADEWI